MKLTWALCFMACLIFPVWTFASSPYESLELAAKALETGDEELFEQKVNVDNIIGEAMDSLARQINQGQTRLPLPMALMIGQLASAPRDAMLGRAIVEEARSFVLNGVSSGAFSGKPTNEKPLKGMLAPLLANASMGRKEISSVGDAQRMDDGYIIPFTIYDHGNGQYYFVEGFFSEDHQRLESIVNIDALVQQVLRESVQ